MQKQVAIVHFKQDAENARMLSDLGHPVPRVIYYQVTLDPARLVGSMIRFGPGADELGQGDEITGWVKRNDIVVDRVLAEWDADSAQFIHSARRAA